MTQEDWLLTDFSGGPRQVRIVRRGSEIRRFHGRAAEAFAGAQTCDDAEAARDAVRRQLRHLICRGYHLGKRSMELESRIQQTPDDDAPYLVYADWLEDQGDPRASWIRVHFQLRDKPGNGALLRQRDALLAAHQTQLLPAGRAEGFLWRRGFIAQAVAESRFHGALPSEASQRADAERFARRLRRHPSGIALRRVGFIRQTWGQEGGRRDVWGTIRAGGELVVDWDPS